MACFVLVGSLAPSGCTPTCDLDTIAERFTGGEVTQVGTGSFYESSSWHGELLNYPGGKRFEIVHNLGVEPAVVLAYMSFAATGVPAEGTSGADSITLCPGDTCKIERVSREVIQIHNTTCADFWLRVVAWGGSAPLTDGGPADGALADGGTPDAP